MKVLGLITARGGSKGVPRKNIRLLAGKPLLHYTIEAGLKAHSLDKLAISTDDDEIAESARQAGAEVPFLRPAELAQDNTPTLPVIRHALEWYAQKGEVYDVVVLLQPTNPFRLEGEIDGAVQLMKEKGFDSVISIKPVPHEFNPHWVYFKNTSEEMMLSTGEAVPIPRRQDLPEAWCREGSIYVMKSKNILKDGNLYGKKVGGYEILRDKYINIDTLEDWAAAEQYLKEKTSISIH